MEVAALGLKVEGVEGIDRAAASLDGLAAAGVKAEKSTQGVGRGSAGAKPSVDALAASADKAAQAEARLAAQAERAGMSVNQLKNAIRGVPAQFTDIAVSIQGGMSPLTVFLQQGGQLKDMFGGAGNAARALGGYVSGLINPFTVTAAAIAGIGVAYFQGSKEQDAFMVSMAKTGNSAGVTTSSLKAYAEQISATVGTQGKAAESLNIFIDSGVKAGASLSRLTETAIAWEKATGEGVDKVAAKYVALQNDPLKAAMKLNEGMNFLTLSVYEQVKSLEEQGRTTDAAKVAMDALDSAMAERSKTIEQNLGSIQRGWNGITGAAKKAWDAMLNVGRPASINDQLLDVEKQLERLMGQQGFGETEGGAATGRVSAGQQAKIKESIRLLQEQKAALMGQAEAERWSADATKKNSDAVAAKAAWDKIVTPNLSKQAKMELELENVRNKALAAGIKGKPLEDELIAVREKYADKTKKSNAAVNAAKTAYESLIVSIQEKIAATKSELASGEKQSEADKFRAKYQQELTTRTRQFTEAQKKKIESDIAAYEVLEKQLNAAKELEKAWAEDAKALESYTKKQDDYLKTVTDSVTKLEQEEEGHTLAAQAGITHAEAMQQLAIARLEDARAQMVQGAGSADEIDRIDQEIKARQKLLGLLGTTAAREANEKAAKDALKEWEKTSELIGDTLADYIMGGGKDAATYLKRLFATLVLQPVVKYGVQGALNSLGMGQGQGAASGAAAGGMPGGGLTDWSSWGTNASNWLSDQGISAIGNGWSEVGSGLHNLGQTIQGVDTFIKDLPGMSGGIGSAAGYLGAIYSLSQGKVGAAAGTAIGNYLLPGIGTMIGGMLGGLLDGLDDSGTKHMGAGAIYSSAGGLQTGAGIYNQGTFGLGHPDEYSEAMQSGVSEITKGLAQTLDAFSVAFGKTAGYSVATAFADDSSKDGAWGSLKIADEVGKVLVDWGMDRESKFAPREFADGEAGYKEYLNAVAVDVKNAFVAMDLPGWADQILNAATDIDTLNAALQQIATVKTVFEGLGKTMGMFADLSGDLQTRLLSASGGVEALASNAGAFYESFYTEGERALKQRELQMAALAGMGLSIDPYQGDAAKEAFRKTVEDAMAAGQAEMAAQLLAMSSAFAQTADYAQGLTESIKEVAESIIDLRGPLISLESRFAGGGFSRQYRAEDAAAQLQKLLSGVGIEKDAAGLASTLMSATASEVESYFREIWNVLPTDAAKLELSGLANTMLDLAAATEEAREAAAQATAQAVSGAWANLGTASGWAAQYLGDSSGLQAQMGMVQTSYQGETTVAGRESALGQIIALEQSIWQVEEQNRQAAAQAAQKQVQALQGQLSAINSIISATQRLREYAEGLFAGSDSGLNDAERLNVLAAQYSTQLALAKGGDVEAMSKLQGVTSDYLALAEQMSGSQAEYSALSSKIASELASTAFIQEVSAKTQADTLQAQIDASTAAAEQASKQFEVSAATKALIAKQLTDSAEQFAIEVQAMQKQLQAGMDTNLLLEGLPSELTGVLNNTLVPVIGTIADAAMAAASMSAASAEAARQAAASASAAASAAAAAALAGMKVDGSHAGGLSNVPFNGYRAILHKDEAVLTAEENRAYRSSGSSSGSVRTNEIVSAIIAMKNDNRLTSVEMLSRVGQIVRVLNSWDGNGLPETREETA